MHIGYREAASSGSQVVTLVSEQDSRSEHGLFASFHSRQGFLKGAARAGLAGFAAGSVHMDVARAASSSVVYWSFFTDDDGTRIVQRDPQFACAWSVCSPPGKRGA